MPRRLLLAAEILRDVARTVNAADRPLLHAAADELAERAAELLAMDDAGPAAAAGRAPAGRWAHASGPGPRGGELLLH